MKHFADPDFWFHYRQFQDDIRELADKSFTFLKAEARHSAVRLKKIGVLYSARVGLHYRALAKERPHGLQWFWVGHHSMYIAYVLNNGLKKYAFIAVARSKPLSCLGT